MKRITAVAAAVVLGLCATAVALAQTGDATPDGNGHPNVGALLAKRADGSLRIVCSGTLVSPRVFLTAGHCTSFLESLGQTEAYVTFDPGFGLNADHSITATPYKGAVITNPRYKAPYLHDTGAVLLDAAATGIAPATVAPLGFLDALRASGAIRSTPFLNVGYGSAEQLVVPTVGPTFPFDGIRKWTISTFSALDPAMIHLNQNLYQGNSGTGYGDSGGPTFVDTANGPVVVSVVSTGDVPCWATSVNTRTDTEDAQSFLASVLART
jgi:trypsin